ncbi:hypothetical protein DI272_43320 [Streptomyces sp. Act143]|uniref:hypothetical protein n=1 Tax=Streptomyces sp. Act143 TaxID=2200760 RepID=UPI000D67CE56|nr:hypothetical protein [Streptomyces sp. Act143]PWI12713.1 hypothetical protein DI272_43320 [Streptomyces sp. Act143]
MTTSLPPFLLLTPVVRTNSWGSPTAVPGPDHKPELLCAPRPCEVICGFHTSERTTDLLETLAVPHPGHWTRVLRSPSGRRSYTVAVYATVADDIPGDRGLLVALLLHHVRPQAGEALYLTDKHVDASLLADIVGLAPTGPAVIRAVPADTPGEVQYRAPAEEFVLSRVTVGAEAVRRTHPGPQVLPCWSGEVRLGPGEDPAAGSGPGLAPGGAVFVPAGAPCRAVGGADDTETDAEATVAGASAVLHRAGVPLDAAS